MSPENDRRVANTAGVPPGVSVETFYKVDYQPLEGETDVSSGDVRSGAAGLAWWSGMSVREASRRLRRCRSGSAGCRWNCTVLSLATSGAQDRRRSAARVAYWAVPVVSGLLQPARGSRHGDPVLEGSHEAFTGVPWPVRTGGRSGRSGRGRRRGGRYSEGDAAAPEQVLPAEVVVAVFSKTRR